MSLEVFNYFFLVFENIYTIFRIKIIFKKLNLERMSFFYIKKSNKKYRRIIKIIIRSFLKNMQNVNNSKNRKNLNVHNRKYKKKKCPYLAAKIVIDLVNLGSQIISFSVGSF